MTSQRVVSKGVIMKLWPFLLGALIVCFVVAVSQIYGSVFIDGVTVVHDYWSLIGGATALGFGMGILITYLLHRRHKRAAHEGGNAEGESRSA